MLSLGDAVASVSELIARKGAHAGFAGCALFPAACGVGHVTMAYFTAPAYYNVVREMPAGKGFADLAFIPRREAGSRPAMIIELKWNDSADTAIRQIKERRYAGALAGCSREVLLVGISYGRELKDKRHSCIIEKLEAGALLHF